MMSRPAASRGIRPEADGSFSQPTNKNQEWYQKLCRPGDPPEKQELHNPSPQRVLLQMQFQREYQQRQELQKNCRQDWWQKKSHCSYSAPLPSASFHTPSPAHRGYTGGPSQHDGSYHPQTPHPAAARSGNPPPYASHYVQSNAGERQGGGMENPHRLERERLEQEKSLEREKMIRTAHLIKHDTEKRMRESQQGLATMPREQESVQRKILQLLKEQEMADRCRNSNQNSRTPRPAPAQTTDLQHKIAKLLQAYEQVPTQHLSAAHQRNWQDQVTAYNNMVQAYRQGNLNQSYQQAKLLLHLLLRREPSTSTSQLNFPFERHPQHPQQQSYYQHFPTSSGTAGMQPFFRTPLPRQQPPRTRRDPRLNQSSQQYQTREHDITPRFNQSSYQSSEQEQDISQEIICRAESSGQPTNSRRNSTPRKLPVGEQSFQDENGNVLQEQDEKPTCAEQPETERSLDKPSPKTDLTGLLGQTDQPSKELGSTASRSPSAERRQTGYRSTEKSVQSGPKEHLHDWEQLQQRSQRHRQQKTRRHQQARKEDSSVQQKLEDNREEQRDTNPLSTEAPGKETETENSTSQEHVQEKRNKLRVMQDKQPKDADKQQQEDRLGAQKKPSTHSSEPQNTTQSSKDVIQKPPEKEQGEQANSTRNSPTEPQSPDIVSESEFTLDVMPSIKETTTTEKSQKLLKSVASVDDETRKPENSKENGNQTSKSLTAKSQSAATAKQSTVSVKQPPLSKQNVTNQEVKARQENEEKSKSTPHQSSLHLHDSRRDRHNLHENREHQLGNPRQVSRDPQQVSRDSQASHKPVHIPRDPRQALRDPRQTPRDQRHFQRDPQRARNDPRQSWRESVHASHGDPPRQSGIKQSSRNQYDTSDSRPQSRSPREHGESRQSNFGPKNSEHPEKAKSPGSNGSKSPGSMSQSKLSYSRSTGKSPTGPQNDKPGKRKSPKNGSSPSDKSVSKTPPLKSASDPAKKGEASPPGFKPRRRRNRRRLLPRDRFDTQHDKPGADFTPHTPHPVQDRNRDRDQQQRNWRSRSPRRWNGSRYDDKDAQPRRRRYQLEWNDSRASPAKKWRGDALQDGASSSAVNYVKERRRVTFDGQKTKTLGSFRMTVKPTSGSKQSTVEKEPRHQVKTLKTEAKTAEGTDEPNTREAQENERSTTDAVDRREGNTDCATSDQTARHQDKNQTSAVDSLTVDSTDDIKHELTSNFFTSKTLQGHCHQGGAEPFTQDELQSTVDGEQKTETAPGDDVERRTERDAEVTSAVKELSETGSHTAVEGHSDTGIGLQDAVDETPKLETEPKNAKEKESVIEPQAVVEKIPETEIGPQGEKRDKGTETRPAQAAAGREAETEPGPENAIEEELKFDAGPGNTAEKNLLTSASRLKVAQEKPETELEHVLAVLAGMKTCDQEDDTSLATSATDDRTTSLPTLATSATDDQTPSLPTLATSATDDQTPFLRTLATSATDDQTPSLPTLATRATDDQTPSLPTLATSATDDQTTSLPILEQHERVSATSADEVHSEESALQRRNRGVMSSTDTSCDKQSSHRRDAESVLADSGLREPKMIEDETPEKLVHLTQSQRVEINEGTKQSELSIESQGTTATHEDGQVEVILEENLKNGKEPGQVPAPETKNMLDSICEVGHEEKIPRKDTEDTEQGEDEALLTQTADDTADVKKGSEVGIHEAGSSDAVSCDETMTADKTRPEPKTLEKEPQAVTDSSLGPKELSPAESDQNVGEAVPYELAPTSAQCERVRSMPQGAFTECQQKDQPSCASDQPATVTVVKPKKTKKVSFSTSCLHDIQKPHDPSIADEHTAGKLEVILEQNLGEDFGQQELSSETEHKTAAINDIGHSEKTDKNGTEESERESGSLVTKATDDAKDVVTKVQALVGKAEFSDDNNDEKTKTSRSADLDMKNFTSSTSSETEDRPAEKEANFPEEGHEDGQEATTHHTDNLDGKPAEVTDEGKINNTDVLGEATENISQEVAMNTKCDTATAEKTEMIENTTVHEPVPETDTMLLLSCGPQGTSKSEITPQTAQLYECAPETPKTVEHHETECAVRTKENSAESVEKCGSTDGSNSLDRMEKWFRHANIADLQHGKNFTSTDSSEEQFYGLESGKDDSGAVIAEGSPGSEVKVILAGKALYDFCGYELRGSKSARLRVVDITSSKILCDRLTASGIV